MNTQELINKATAEYERWQKKYEKAKDMSEKRHCYVELAYWQGKRDGMEELKADR